MKFFLLILFCIANTRYADAQKMQGLDAGMQVFVKNDGLNKTAVAFAAYAMHGVDTARKPPFRKRDSLKYFPTLLGDNMSINFDPNKYASPKRPAIDTSLTPEQAAYLNSIAKKTPGLPGNAIAKESGDVPKKSNNNIAAASANAIPLPANEPKQKDTAPLAITQRTTSLVTTYKVSSPHISVQLFDDGQIDGDAVSVYYNGKIIINNQTLTHKAITFSLEASAANRHHEIVLISESEGFLPPNSALMRIKAGSEQFELNVNSSNARNAEIVIDYTGE